MSTPYYTKADDLEADAGIRPKSNIAYRLVNSSGVTRVGVTRGDNLCFSPLFFLGKIWRPVIASESDGFLAVVSLPLPFSHCSV